MGSYLGPLIGTLIGALLVVPMMHAMRKSKQRRAESDAVAGRQFTVYASIRLRGADGWQGRWRHGFAVVSPNTITWRPKRPRPGPPVTLPWVLIGPGRPVQSGETWWLNSAVTIFDVYSAPDPSVRYDLALLPESVPLVRNGLWSSGA